MMTPLFCLSALRWINGALSMKTVLQAALVIFALGMIAGCDQIGVGGSGVAILDLSAVAKATGQDEAIRQQAEAARAELGAQLQQLATNLEAQLAEEREKVGVPPSEADVQRLQEMTAQARQQINDAQTLAQNQAGQFENTLVTEFRAKIDPLAEKIARQRGASAVLAADSYLFWFDPETDITDEVIAAWRALPADEAVADAETQAELEAVEEELAEVEEEIAELKEAIEETALPAAE
jgi:Skp family chaperone for outer membrane proteins